MTFPKLVFELIQSSSLVCFLITIFLLFRKDNSNKENLITQITTGLFFSLIAFLTLFYPLEWLEKISFDFSYTLIVLAFFSGTKISGIITVISIFIFKGVHPEFCSVFELSPIFLIALIAHSLSSQDWVSKDKELSLMAALAFMVSLIIFKFFPKSNFESVAFFLKVFCPYLAGNLQILVYVCILTRIIERGHSLFGSRRPKIALKDVLSPALVVDTDLNIAGYNESLKTILNGAENLTLHGSLSKIISETDFFNFSKLIDVYENDPMNSNSKDPLSTKIRFGNSYIKECRPIFESDSSLSGLLFHIAAREEIEAENRISYLEESKFKYESVIEEIDAFIARFKKDGTILFVNANFCDFVDKSPLAVAGKNIFELLSSDKTKWIVEIISQATPENSSFSETVQIEEKNSDSKWYQWDCRCFFDEAGKLDYIHALGRDVTNDFLQKIALKDSEEKFRLMVDNSPLMIALVREDGRAEYLNQAWEVLGYSLAELKQMTFHDITHPDFRDFNQTMYEKVFRNEIEIAKFEKKYICKNGEPFDARATIILLKEFAKKKLFLGIVEDLSQSRLLEKQLLQAQKMEAVGRLAGGIAHDFNNLLQVMMGYIDLSREELKDSTSLAGEYLDSVAVAGEKAKELVKQLLLFSRKEEMIMRQFDPAVMIRDHINMVERVIGEDISLRLNLNETLTLISGDAGQLEQVLLNLCVNAKDAMPAGGSINITTENCRIVKSHKIFQDIVVPGDYFVLKIQDNGEGMCEDLLAKIFDPFFTTKEIGKGTGLGLATAFSIIKSHKGYIDVKSKPGNGTEFQIYLPIIGDFDDLPIKVEEKAISEDLNVQGKVVLLAEDDELVRKLTVSILRKSGFKVLFAQTGLEACEIFEKNSEEIDLLIFDVIMPQLSGPEAFRRIQKIKNVPVLFCTGYSDEQINSEFMEQISGNILHKPFTKKDLLKEISVLLNK